MKRKLLYAMCLLFLPGIAVAIAMRQVPAESSGGNGLSGAAYTATTIPTARLRVAAFNMHSGRGARGEDLALTAKTLEGFDLVALNEVQGVGPFRTRDQADLLGEMLGMQWLFAASERRLIWEDFGNGILARVPVGPWRKLMLDSAHENAGRCMVRLDVMCGTAPLHMLVVHLARKQDHDAQLRTVTQTFLQLSGPALLMGDFNARRSESGMRQLLNAPDVIDALGTDLPDRIDWVFVRGLKVIRSGTRDLGASDHPLVWAELELP